MNFFHGYLSTQYVLHQKHVHIHAYCTRCTVMQLPRAFTLHGCGRLLVHGSNVSTYSTWARTRRVGVISDGRYHGRLWCAMKAGQMHLVFDGLANYTGML